MRDTSQVFKTCEVSAAILNSIYRIGAWFVRGGEGKEIM